jgi:cyanate lyase
LARAWRPRRRLGTDVASILAGFRAEKEGAVTRAELTAKITSIRQKKRLSWRAIAREIGPLSPVFYTAALLGQMKLEKSEAEAAGRFLGLDEDEVLLLQEVPYRGGLPTAVPTDPVIYRFYELLQVYGTTWKALIEEEFGDGIMSAIDFDMALERQPDPKGDRVRLTMSGKFLSYKRY